MAVNDEIWRPGYDGPPPVTGPISMADAPSGATLPGGEHGGAHHGGHRGEDRRRMAKASAAVATIGAVMLATIVVTGALPSDPQLERSIEVRSPPDPVQEASSTVEPLDQTSLGERFLGERLDLLDGTGAPFAGADPRRLPTELVSRWTVDLGPLVADGGGQARTWIEAVDDRYVVVGIGDLRTLSGPGVVVVLDAATGEQLWAQEVPIRIDQVEFVAAIGDVLVLTMASEVVALDLTSGSRLWESRLAKVGGPLQQIGHLQGTDLLVRTDPEPGSSAVLIEATTGVVVGEFVGEILGTDGVGTWYVLRGAKLLEFDLSPFGPERSGGGGLVPEVGRLVATIDPERSQFAAVVGDFLVTTVDGIVAVGPITVDSERNVGPGGFTPLTVGAEGPPSLPLVRNVIPLPGSAFVTVGGGMISGAEVEDGTVRFAWHRRGALAATFPTDRGALLLVATDGGAAQTLVDASSGSTISALTVSPGFLGALDVVGNGIVTRRTSTSGPRIAGLDLDGEEMWSLDGTTPVAIGDRIVVRSTPQADGSFEVSAYGDRAVRSPR